MLRAGDHCASGADVRLSGDGQCGPARRRKLGWRLAGINRGVLSGDRNPLPQQVVMRQMFERVFLIMALVALAACGQPPEIVGIDNPEVPVDSVPQATQHKVFIATTREDSEVVGALFSDLRADGLGYASVAVSVPPSHEAGNLERPKSLPPRFPGTKRPAVNHT